MVATWYRRSLLMELYLFVFIYMTSVVLVFVSGRYRLLEIAPMSIFAGAAFWKVVIWVQSRQWRNIAMACASITGMIFLLKAYSLEPFPIRMNDYVMLARYYDRIGNTESSIATMHKAVGTFETAPSGDATFEATRKATLFFERGELAWYYTKTERWQEARNVLELEMKSNNEDESLVLMLIQTYTQLGEKNRAINLARFMSHRHPENPQWQATVQVTENLPD